MKLKKLLFVLILVGFMLSSVFVAANPWNGKVVLQGFWWDYYNSNYSEDWATYLADLAPRLREMGIDAVWIPPTIKNKNATGSVGYSPFDHYDLGDKYQAGSTATRFGDKDDYLRAVAILHANGIDVIQDMVWNHVDGAGSVTGDGGMDPAAWSNQWKNFRYACYATTVDTEYDNREGRFPKNWPNFHPNPGHDSESGDWCEGYWGPDVCYYTGAYGQSSNCDYNPAQSADYMRHGMREWSIWLKKQTGVDGFRLDAVKHFPHWATKDFLWNMAYNAGWASGGYEMFVVGEYVGSKSELDGWVDAVNNSDGYTDVVGTFDFSLRQALKSMTSSSGYYDLGSIVGQQQDRRNRTVPFVNNHDTFRPQVDGTGNYIGWDIYNELGGGHIDPFDPRVELAYAIAMAVDGSPQIFFEDLFNIGSTGLRWSHDPRNSNELPVRDYLKNLIYCHQKLNFKDGAYRVRHQSADHLVIERSGHAIISANDNWDTWQNAWIYTDFAPGTQLHDYSGANSNDIWVNNDGWVQIWTPPCNGSNIRRGYSVWGPAGIGGGFSPAQRSTTQEWELANDLGDSHASSLQQGGALPVNSTALRVAGNIYAEAGQPITVKLYPENSSKRLELRIYSSSNRIMSYVRGYGELTLNYTPTVTDFYKIKVKNYYGTNPSQRVWVKATYTAPQVLDSGGLFSAEESRDDLEEVVLKSGQNRSGEVVLKAIYPNPFNPSTAISFSLPEAMDVKLTVYNSSGQRVATLRDEVMAAGEHTETFDGSGLASGMYFVKLITPNFSLTERMTLLK